MKERLFSDPTHTEVYAGYGIFCGLHVLWLLWDGLRWWRKRKVAWFRMCVHGFATSVAFATIFVMKKGIYPTRWHHMSYGLICMLTGLRSVTFFGFCMVIDSMLYWDHKIRGDDDYDYGNIFLKYTIPMTCVIVGCAILELATRHTPKRSSLERHESEQELLAFDEG